MTIDEELDWIVDRLIPLPPATCCGARAALLEKREYARTIIRNWYDRVKEAVK